MMRHTSLSLSPLDYAPPNHTTWLIKSDGAVWFRGVKYVPLPVEVTQMQGAARDHCLTTAEGSNVGGLATALSCKCGDIVERMHPDADLSPFLTVNRTPMPRCSSSPTCFRRPQIAPFEGIIEFELATALDQHGILLPSVW
jgi:phage-related protein